MERVAIIGGGIAGLACAYRLQGTHDVTVFEKAPVLGGHALTVDLPDGTPINPYVVTFAPKYYARFFALMDEIGFDGFESAPMGMIIHQSGRILHGDPPTSWRQLRDNWRTYLDVRSAPSVLHWAKFAAFMGRFYLDYRRGRLPPDAPIEDLETIYPQHREIIRFWAMPFAFLKSQANLNIKGLADMLLGSVDLERLLHGDIIVTAPGGVRSYIEHLASKIDGTLHTSTPVTRLTRTGSGFEVTTAAHGTQTFDRVIVAAAPIDVDRFLDPWSAEVGELFAGLDSIYEATMVVVHADDTVMCGVPRRLWGTGGFNFDPVSQHTSISLYVTTYLPQLRTSRIVDDGLFITYVDPYGIEFRERFDWKNFDWSSLPPGFRIDPERIYWGGIERHPLWGRPAQRARFDRIMDYSGRDGLHFAGVGLNRAYAVGQEGAMKSVDRVLDEIGR